MAVRSINLPPAANLIRFGAFELDLRSRELRKDGRSTGLPEQSIKVLHMLLERPGELILREEIRARLWPNDTVVEFDHSINTALRKLRVALGDSADHPRYIETLARRGYRWIGPVESLFTEEPIAALPKAPPESEGSELLSGLLTGKRVSHYRVLEVLGGGGMGVVYKAEDLKLGRRVALKFLPEELAHDPVALKRLEQEARAASALNHPNVCTIYEIAEHEARPFIVMEFLEGETLRERIGRQAGGQTSLTLDQQIELGVQISDALATAHAHGIIHRDVKPANVFVTRAGVAKILDFGVAKLSRPPAGDEDRSCEHFREDIEGPDRKGPIPTPPANDPSLTRTGITMGTAGYMSPEQVRGELVDSRTDLFSFGLVLYEMATGRTAFGAPTVALMRAAILNREPVPVRQLNAAIPDELARIIGKALEKDRDKRYQSAADMRADLQRLRPKVPARPPSRWKALAAGSAALLILAVSITWLRWRQPVAPAWPEAKMRQETTNSWESPVTSGAISPDGRYLAYSDAKGMHIKFIGTDDSQLVPQPEALAGEKVAWDIGSSAWFPDSKQFVATAHPAAEDPHALTSATSSIWTVSVSNGAPRKLRDAARAWNVSPDGVSISFGTGAGRLGERELWMMESDGEHARRVLEVDDSHSVCCMYFFSGGTRVAYVTADDSGPTLVARDLKGGPVTTLLPPSVLSPGSDIVWLPDGRLIYTDTCEFGAPCNLWMERFDTQSGKLTERARRLATVTEASLHAPSAASDGRLMTFLRSAGYGTTYVADLEPGATGVRNLRHFSLVEGDDSIADWTPDSQTAIIVRTRSDHSALYKQALPGDHAEPIVARLDGWVLEAARVSPDAKWVVLLVLPMAPPPTGPGHAPPPLQVWRVPINGGPLQLLFSLAGGSALACARGPATLCVTGEPTTDRRQTIVSAFDAVTGLRGTELIRFDRYAYLDEDPGSLSFDLSPDGQWLGISATPSGPLRILSLRGAPERVVPVQGLNVRALNWTGDGEGLIVSGYRHGDPVLLHVDLQANVHLLLQCESRAPCFADPSPDGRYLGVYQVRTMSNIWMVGNF